MFEELEVPSTQIVHHVVYLLNSHTVSTGMCIYIYMHMYIYNRPFMSIRPYTIIYVSNYCTIGANVMDNQTEESLKEVENTSRQRVQLRTGW